jgi:hypothetical protein
MASAPPRPGPIRSSQSDRLAVDVDSPTGDPAPDDLCRHRAIAFLYRTVGPTTGASATTRSLPLVDQPDTLGVVVIACDETAAIPSATACGSVTP